MERQRILLQPPFPWQQTQVLVSWAYRTPPSDGRHADCSSDEDSHGEQKRLIFWELERPSFQAAIITQLPDFLTPAPSPSAFSVTELNAGPQRTDKCQKRFLKPEGYTVFTLESNTWQPCPALLLLALPAPLLERMQGFCNATCFLRAAIFSVVLGFITN